MFLQVSLLLVSGLWDMLFMNLKTDHNMHVPPNNDFQYMHPIKSFLGSHDQDQDWTRQVVV